MANLCENRLEITISPELLESQFYRLLRISLYRKHPETIDGHEAELMKHELLSEGDMGLFESVDPAEEVGGVWDPLYSHWGTRRDVYADELHDAELPNPATPGEVITLHFYTAWSPPDGFAQKLSQEYKCYVTLSYGEMGMDFSGVISWDSGDVVDEETGEYGEFYGCDTDEDNNEDDNEDDDDEEEMSDENNHR